MNGESRKEREERAFDALLVSILRRADKDDDIVEQEKLPELTEEEKAAMKALDTDFIDRILAGERPIARRQVPRPGDTSDNDDAALAASGAECAMNRAEEIDDETADELERQKRDILERKDREQQQTDESPG